MAEHIVSLVVKNLGDLLIAETKFLNGVESQVDDLRRELIRMQCFLKETDARQYEDKRIRNWVEEVRDLAIEAEDVIDMYIFKVSSKTSTRGASLMLDILKKFVHLVRHGKTLHNFGEKIDAIKGKVTNLRESLQTYGIKDLRESEGSSLMLERRQLLRKAYSHIIDQDFIGFENDVNILVAKLLSGIKDEPYQVVSIYGMGGSGKTTLARKVYYHGNIRRGFDVFAWCCVSQQWQKEDVLRQILIGLVPEKEEEIAKQRDELLVKQLFEILKDRKCLVVLDDVWSSDIWNIMRSAIPNQRMASKILLTTRKQRVALHTDRFGFHHELKQLSVEEGWGLLQKKAFPRAGSTGQADDGNMVKLGKKIVKYCKCLPLAIVLVGGILATKHSLEEWKKVYESISLEGKNIGVLETLALSYNDLPYQLKPCFLYLGIFPKDKKIHVKRLYELWIGEGFVASKDLYEDDTMMDLAEYYLRELAQRCMVQVQVSKDTGRIESCQLHGHMREFCLSKGKEEKFIEVIGMDSTTSSSSIICLSKGKEEFIEVTGMDSTTSSSSIISTRRVAINLDKDSRFVIPKRKKSPHLKSIVFFGPCSFDIDDKKETMFDIMDLKLLKVLDLKKFGHYGQLPKDIEKLILLRYLSLPWSSLSSSLKLPSSVGNLMNLQTLDLRVSTSTKLDIPNVLWKLKELRHLYFPENYRAKKKLKLKGLSKLETLENFSYRQCNGNDISKLSQLRILTTNGLLKKLEDFRGINNYLGALRLNRNILLRQHSISLYWTDDRRKYARVVREIRKCHHFDELFMAGPIIDGLLPLTSALNEQQYFSVRLTRLILYDSQLREDPMPTLERLPKLQLLELTLNAFVGKEMRCCTPNGFPSLKSLTLDLLDNLENWSVGQGALPSLSSLIIDSCYKLKMVPSGLKSVGTLQQLMIAGMPELKRRIRDEDGKEGEDFHKVQHIPDLHLF